MKVVIYYAKDISRAKEMEPLAKSIGERLSSNFNIKIKNASDGIEKADLIIAATGPGQEASRDYRALESIVMYSKAPKLVAMKNIIKWPGLNYTLSYVNKDGKLIFLSDKYIDDQHFGFVNGLKPGKFKFKRWGSSGDHILFCAQNGYCPYLSFNTFHTYEKWQIDSLRYILKNTNRPILYRPHPKKRAKQTKFIEKLNSFNRIIISESGRKLSDDFNLAYSIVTYNSSIFIDAIMNGIPTNLGCDYFVTSEVASVGIENFNEIKKGSRTEWLKKIYNANWSYQEIEKGLATEYVLSLGIKDDFQNLE